MNRLNKRGRIGSVFVAALASLGLFSSLIGAPPLKFSPPPEGASIEVAMASLATRAIAEYHNDGSDSYLNNLFRLQMTARRYADANATVIESIRRSMLAHRSVSTLIPDRVFAQAKLHEQSGVPTNDAINRAGTTVLGELDDKAAADADVWLWAPLNRLSQNLNQALDRQRSLGAIEFPEALNLIRAYQLYQEYQALAPVSENLIAADDARRYIIARDVSVKTKEGVTLCSREDLQAGRPPHWRTVHQHPASRVCPFHKTLLHDAVIATSKRPQLLNPASSIPPNLPAQSIESPLELRIAHDLHWLIRSKAAIRPGRHRLSAAICQLLVSETRYRRGRFVNRQQVVADLRSGHDPSLLDSFGCGMQATGIAGWLKRLLGGTEDEPFYRYSLLLHHLGVCMSDLFERAMRLPEDQFLDVDSAESLAQAKSRISTFVKGHPSATRVDIVREVGNDMRIAMKADKHWWRRIYYKDTRPDPFHSRVRSELDDELLKLVSAANHRLREQIAFRPEKRLTRHRIVEEAGLFDRKGLRVTARLLAGTAGDRSLPKTTAALGSFAEDDLAFVKRKANWAKEQFSAVGNRFAFLTFKNRAVIALPCDRCTLANAAAFQAWTEYRRLIAPISVSEGQAACA